MHQDDSVADAILAGKYLIFVLGAGGRCKFIWEVISGNTWKEWRREQKETGKEQVTAVGNRDSVPLGTLQETVEHTSEWLHQGPRSWCLNTLIG